MITAGVGQKMRWASTGRPRSGFTLVEVLVVLAILIILFALLFAPMIASLDMVTLGQARVAMQDSVREVMAEMRREIGSAMYIYPTPEVALAGADLQFGTADDTRIALTSEIVFVSPAYDSNGRVITPPTPRTQKQNPADLVEQIVATRLRAALVDETQPYSEDNPFVVVREEGFYHYDATTHTWSFAVLGGTASPVRNLLTPRSRFDLPATTTMCTGCGTTVAGYSEDCPNNCGVTGAQRVRLHANLQFKPERVVGELLAASSNFTQFRSKYGAWDGFTNDGSVDINDLDGAGGLMTLGASELDPRLVIMNPVTGAVVRDTSGTSDTSRTLLTWSSEGGEVQVGAPTVRVVTVQDPGTTVTPGMYHTLDVAGDSYAADGTLGGARTSDLVPIYPTFGGTPMPGDPTMPIAYRLDPSLNGADYPAKIVPGTVRVRVFAQTSSNRYQMDLTETANDNQGEIGEQQFAVVLSNHDQTAEVRFNEMKPPGPELLGDTVRTTLVSFELRIEYYFRRNYDPTDPATDYVIRADYSTRELINIDLALQRYIEPEEAPCCPGVLIVPADATLDRVAARDQVQVRNMAR